MKKTVIKDDVFYVIAWSPLRKYDKHEVQRVLPELPGILSLSYIDRNEEERLLYYSCWRDGFRDGMRNLMDITFSRVPKISRQLENDRLHYRYAVVDSSIKDLQDVMFWLITTYTPRFNNPSGLDDSKRYANIYVKEISLKEDDVVERIPRGWMR